jgi:NADPH-dependent curcumin reductase
MDNRQILLKRRPKGAVQPDDFDTVVTPTPQLLEGEVLVRTVYLSIDIPLRLWLEIDIPLDGGFVLPKVELGQVITAFGSGVVVESRNPELPVGAAVGGMLGLQEYTVVKKGNPFNHRLPDGVPLDVALNGLGNTGMTAYFGFFDLGATKSGDTVLISAAAGSIGVIVGQLAKNAGCHVIGLAGSDEKVAWLVEDVGFDGAINYKTEDLDARLSALCPNNINLYFDIVGGEILDTVLGHMANHGRVVACGTMAEEGGPGTWNGIHRLYSNLLSKRITVVGLNASDYIPRYADAGKQLMEWSSEGKLRWFETIIEGLDRAPEALNALYEGGNKGKMLVKVTDL